MSTAMFLVNHELIKIFLRKLSFYSDPPRLKVFTVYKYVIAFEEANKTVSHKCKHSSCYDM